MEDTPRTSCELEVDLNALTNDELARMLVEERARRDEAEENENRIKELLKVRIPKSTSIIYHEKREGMGEFGVSVTITHVTRRSWSYNSGRVLADMPAGLRPSLVRTIPPKPAEEVLDTEAFERLLDDDPDFQQQFAVTLKESDTIAVKGIDQLRKFRMVK
jgi:hypothetical protein